MSALLGQSNSAGLPFGAMDERFCQIAEYLPQVFWLTNGEKDEFLFVSPAYAEIWGRSCAALLAAPQQWVEGIHPADRRRVVGASARQRDGNYDEEYRVVRPDGTERWVRERAFPVRDGAGKIYRIAGIVEDITHRKLTTDVLREAERRFREMLETMELAAVILDRRGEITFCNDYLLHLTGRSREEVLGKNWFTTFKSDSTAEAKEVFTRGIEEGNIARRFENRIQTPQGTARDILWSNTVLRDLAGKVVGTAGIGEDVTERRRADMRSKLQHAVTSVLKEGGALREVSGRLLETIGTGLQGEVGELWTVDRATKQLCCTNSWSVPTREREEFLIASREREGTPGGGLIGRVWTSGRASASLDIANDPECLRRVAAGKIGLRSWIGFPIAIRNEVVGVVGLFSVRVRVADEELLSLLTDMGNQIGQFIERQRLAEQFQQAQKMEAIGTLAGGIAHDFNNIIAGISGYAELAKMELGNDKVVAEHLEAVRRGADRAAGLVRQIMAIGRKQEQERRLIQLRHILKEALDLLRATIPTTIEFKTTFASDLPAVFADPTQIHQIVMNLGTNAWHAMKDGPGRIEIALERCEVDATIAELHPGLHVGTYVRLGVSDTGSGMEPATVDRIFEPFFTTKPAGEGTGLGLAVVHGIMRSHEGLVTVYSQPGKGTLFHLYFPASVTDAPVTVVESRGVSRGHGERILYVDDEEPLAHMIQKVLGQLGYTVEVCTVPAKALEAIRERPAWYDLVITDLTMPGLTGPELARELMALRPSLPVILVTGYSANLTARQAEAMGIAEILLKPMSVRALAEAVHRVLTKPGKEVRPSSAKPKKATGRE